MDKQTWFRKTVVNFEGPLLRYTLKILAQLQPSEEVVQESFLKLWKESYPNGDQRYPKAWLYKVSRNLAIDYLRKNNRLNNEANHEELVSTPCMKEELLDTSLIFREIFKMNKSDQEVLILKFAEDLTYKEISEVTCMTVSHVGNKIHNALKKLKSIMETTGADHD